MAMGGGGNLYQTVNVNVEGDIHAASQADLQRVGIAARDGAVNAVVQMKRHGKI